MNEPIKADLQKRKRRKSILMFHPAKFLKKDNNWLAKLGEKRSKLLRKLISAMKNFNEKTISLPFDLPIVSAEIIHRGDQVSWFLENLDACKLLLRVKDLDDEGIGMHLTEMAKVLQWILWVPLIGDPNTSKQAPDRVWRESTYPSPSSFLLSYVDDDKSEILQDLVADRWDSGMMLGGAAKVKALIYRHIFSDNEEFKDIIHEWTRFLKWHQEFDWEEVSENMLFSSVSSKLDVFWKSEDYCIPERFSSISLWSPEKPNTAQNIREVVAELPGFGDLKEVLQEEALMSLEAEEPKESASEDRVANEEITEVSQGTYETTVLRSMDVNSPPLVKVGFRPDMPYTGANRKAFETHFVRRSLWNSSPLGTERKKRKYSIAVVPQQVTKVKRVKTPKLAKKRKVVKKKRAIKQKKRTKRWLGKRKVKRKGTKKMRKNRYRG